jgi:hypothetical protein
MQTPNNPVYGMSIDDASPLEWHRVFNENYVNPPCSISSTTDSFFLNEEEQVTSTDEINKPAHYNYGKYETIDVIVDTLGKYEAINYCHGNVLKYIIRMWHKGTPEKDLRKAIWYSNKMLELLEETKGVHW